MDRLAARSGDIVFCMKHGVGYINSPDRNVLVNGKNAVVAGDPCPCLPPDLNPPLNTPQYAVPNKVMAGAAQVLVAGIPMSGMMHGTMHNGATAQAPDGFILLGSFDVIVGGNTLVGDTAAAKAACEALAAGRKGNKATQSYDNCGIESVRQLCNGSAQAGDPGYQTEDGAFYGAIQNGQAQVPLNDQQLGQMDATCKGCYNAQQRASSDQYDAATKKLNTCRNNYMANVARRNPTTAAGSGKSGPTDRQNMLNGCGVDNELQKNNLDNAANDAATGRGMISPVSGMPDAQGGTTGDHIVVVTGVELNDQGQPVNVTYNDSSKGCGVSMSADDFKNHMQGDAPANVTTKPRF
jgi:hypothetical protein